MMFLTGSILLLLSISPIYGIKNVVLEQFENDGNNNPNHRWIVVNDPVMGGLSSGKIDIHDGKGIFEGVVKDVPSLDSPGFISMRTSGGYFPDLRSCDGLVLDVQSSNSYKGFRVAFGIHFAGTMRFAQGYKAHFDAPVGSFGEVYIPFDQFSDNWDPKTGDQIVTCQENNEYCPDDETLRNLQRLEIMGEGVSGEVNLQIQSIQARGCADDVVETDPNPEETAKKNSNSYFGGTQNFVGGPGSFILPNGDVRIEFFANPFHAWRAISDPVMGGNSISTFSIDYENGVAIFDGATAALPETNDPGFISMQTRNGYFPDVSQCNGLKINLKSKNKHDGIFVDFGTKRGNDTRRVAAGYKAQIKNIPVEDFDDVVVSFADFSDNWDRRRLVEVDAVGGVSSHAPDLDTLKNFRRLGIVAEGVKGEVYLEIRSIYATGCVHTNDSFGLSAARRYAPGGDSMKNTTMASIGISIGFVLVAGIAFILGRRSGKKSASKRTNIELEVTSPSADIL